MTVNLPTTTTTTCTTTIIHYTRRTTTGLLFLGRLRRRSSLTLSPPSSSSSSSSLTLPFQQRRSTSSLSWIDRVRAQLQDALMTTENKNTTNNINTNNNKNARSLNVATTSFDTCETYGNPDRDAVPWHAPYPLLPSAALPPGHAYAGTHVNGTPLFVYRTTSAKATATANTDKNASISQSTGGRGVVQAYVNACRHRGAPLLKSRPSSETQDADESFVTFQTIPLAGGRRSPLLVCPYHAWTYQADTGQLVGIPGKARAFPCLDMSSLGLQPLECFERAGFIWVNTTSTNSNDLNNHHHNDWWRMQEMDQALQPFLLDPTATVAKDSSSSTSQNGTTRDEKDGNYYASNKNNNRKRNTNNVIGYREWPALAANWQLLVETFLESYHVKTLHEHTLHKVTQPAPWAMVSTWMDHHHGQDGSRSNNGSGGNDGGEGQNFRMTVPLRNFEMPDDKYKSETAANTTTNMATTTNDGNQQQNHHRAKDNKDNNIKNAQKFLSETSTTHFLFPHAAVTLFKRFALFLTLEPVSSSSSSLSLPLQSNGGTTTASTYTRVRAWAMAHPLYDPATAEEKEEKGLENQKRDFQSVLTAIEEDWDMAVQIQNGLTGCVNFKGENNHANNDAPPTFLYGGYETNNVQFLNNVGRVAKLIKEEGLWNDVQKD